MSKQTRTVTPLYTHQAAGIDGFDSLADLALNLRWSWNHATDEVWRQLDPKLWEITNNPWVVLQTASRDKIKRVLGRPGFPQERRWFGRSQPASVGSACLVSEEPFENVPHLRRLFQHGVHVERSSADLLGRAGECGRRSNESGQRSGRTGGGCRLALSAGLFSPGDR